VNTTETVPDISVRAELSMAQTDEMYRLLNRHFDGVSRGQFYSDLEEKSHVIRLRRGPDLVGFSTLVAYETVCEQSPVSVVYSGDTIVAPEAWGTTALPRAWIAAVNQLRSAFPRGRYYWLLLTSGFRTYRFLPLFWREFFPRFDRPTPTEQQRLIHQLATERFGAQYDPHAGIVRFNRPQCLYPELSAIPETRTADPHVSFFATRNPEHARGDELVCLTELSPENLTAAGRRMVSPGSRGPQTRVAETMVQTQAASAL
jgi:hypothetical protein